MYPKDWNKTDKIKYHSELLKSELDVKTNNYHAITLKSLNKAIFSFANIFKAATGEGSRGGHVVGHTKSGKPEYESPMHTKETWTHQKGWISPKGEFHKLDDGTEHHDYIHKLMGKKDKYLSAFHAWQQGWIGVGHGTSTGAQKNRVNVSGTKETFSNPQHPAVVTARKLFKEHPHQFLDVDYGSSLHKVKTHDFVKFGKTRNESKLGVFRSFYKFKLNLIK